MKKNAITGLVAALTVTAGIGAGFIGYKAGSSSASRTVAIEHSQEMENLYSNASDAIQEQSDIASAALQARSNALNTASNARQNAQKAAEATREAEKKAAEAAEAAKKAQEEAEAAQKKAAQEEAQRKEAEQKAAQEEAQRKEAEQKALEQKTFDAKLRIKDAIRTELGKSEGGRLSQESIDYIKNLLANEEAQGLKITFTDNDIRSMELADEDVALLGLEVVG